MKIVGCEWLLLSNLGAKSYKDFYQHSLLNVSIRIVRFLESFGDFLYKKHKKSALENDAVEGTELQVSYLRSQNMILAMSKYAAFDVYVC